MGRLSRTEGERRQENVEGDTSTRSSFEMDIIRGDSQRSEPEKPVTRRTSFRTVRRRRRRSRSAPASPNRRHPLLEDHYLVDRNEHLVLPGMPKYGDDWSRDVHDYFNLIILLPVVVLNVMNWNWDILLNKLDKKTVAQAWTGEWFDPFFWVTAVYFAVDLVWIVAIPSAVRSPATIIQHHIATLLYLIIPYTRPQYQWCMGACMIVEINTWFLIARRVFNKEGFPPWIIDLPPFFSIRVKLISVFFYLTWISIRCVFYPYLAVEFAKMWIALSLKVGTKLNVLAIVLPLHSVFCLLNIKWTHDLIMSKIRWWKKKGRKREKLSKGL